MPNITLLDYKKKREVVADIVEHEGSLVLTFPYNDYVKDSIKGCEGSKFNWDNKTWEIKHPKLSQRNKAVMGWLSRGTFPGTRPDPFYLLTKKIQPQSFYPPGLYQHQKEAIDFISVRKQGILGHKMGLGKTLTTLSYITYLDRYYPELVAYLKDKYHGQEYINTRTTWIIAPNSPLRAWYAELQKWKIVFQPMFITVHHAKIKEAIIDAKVPPAIIVIDEISRFRNRTSKRTDYLFQLVDQAREYWYKEAKLEPVIIGLTGTPAPKDPTNWHALVELVAPGYLIERDARQLMYTVGEVESDINQTGTAFTKVSGWKVDKVKELYNRLAPVVHIRTKEQCLDLPAKEYLEVNLTPSKYVLGLARTIIDTSPRAATALIKLRQLSDGFLYTKNTALEDESNPNNYIEFETPKDAALVDDLESLTEEEETRVLVWSSFTATLDKCVRICLQQGWNVIRVDGRGWAIYYSPVWMDEYTNGKYNKLSPIEQGFEQKKLQFAASQAQFQDLNFDVPFAFVGNCDAGGQGLTLTASKLAIYYSNSFNAEFREQSEDRIHRITTRGAMIKDYLHLPTDRQILNNLKNKKDIQSLSMGMLIDEIALAERQLING